MPDDTPPPSMLSTLLPRRDARDAPRPDDDARDDRDDRRTRSRDGELYAVIHREGGVNVFATRERAAFEARRSSDAVAVVAFDARSLSSDEIDDAAPHGAPELAPAPAATAKRARPARKRGGLFGRR